MQRAQQPCPGHPKAVHCTAEVMIKQCVCPIQYGSRLCRSVSKKQSDEGCLLCGGLFDPQSCPKDHEGQTLPPKGTHTHQ